MNSETITSVHDNKPRAIFRDVVLWFVFSVLISVILAALAKSVGLVVLNHTGQSAPAGLLRLVLADLTMKGDLLLILVCIGAELLGLCVTVGHRATPFSGFIIAALVLLILSAAMIIGLCASQSAPSVATVEFVERATVWIGGLGLIAATLLKILVKEE
jgi:hypothetical protein